MRRDYTDLSTRKEKMKKLFVTFLCIAMVAVFLPAMAFCCNYDRGRGRS